MTDIEQKALVERLRFCHANGIFDAAHHGKAVSYLEAADQIEADGQRIAELEEAVVTLNTLWSREFDAHNKTQEKLIDLQKRIMPRAALGDKTDD